LLKNYENIKEDFSPSWSSLFYIYLFNFCGVSFIMVKHKHYIDWNSRIWKNNL